MNETVEKYLFCDTILHRHMVNSFCRADSMASPLRVDLPPRGSAAYHASLLKGREIMSGYSYIEVDTPAETINRITLNRPEKRNALSNALRCELFAELERADTDPNVRVNIIRGAGKAFSAGYDLTSLSRGESQKEPFYTAGASLIGRGTLSMDVSGSGISQSR